MIIKKIQKNTPPLLSTHRWQKILKISVVVECKKERISPPKQKGRLFIKKKVVKFVLFSKQVFTFIPQQLLRL